MPFKLILFSILLSNTHANDLKFPPGFKFGTATAAYQIEGAWNISDKSESIWDHFTHNSPHFIADRSTGDVACDSYHKWRRDIDMVSELGLHFYRFSISWSRLLPNGFANHISEDGKNYYNNIIDELLVNGIEPIVTLYHWDLPQILQQYGGWTNPLMTDWFADYANVTYVLFADRVKTWVTINEPMVACEIAFNTGVLAPGIRDPDRAGYLCTKNILIAHAKAWRIYDKYFKKKYKGKVSFANHLVWFEGGNATLSEIVNQYGIGRFSHPVYSKEGGWPPYIEKIIAEKSKEQGYPRSRLPAFSKEEIELVKGTYDYFSLNHYTSRLVRKARTNEVLGPWPTEDLPELNTALEIGANWGIEYSLFPVYPKGMRRLMNWLKQQYGNIEIFITENGFGDTEIGLNDSNRVSFLRDYLKQILLAIKEDGVNVTSYTYWSLMDSFEWMKGYKNKFGLYAVNFNDSDRTRAARKSAYYYASVVQSHSLDVPAEPDAWKKRFL